MSDAATSKPAPLSMADLAGAEQKLSVEREDAFADLGWLARSFDDPEAFFRAAFALWAGRGAPPKSRPFERYDLYHDMIARNLGSARPALAWYDRLSRKVEKASYAELHDASAGKAGEWAAQKVKAGDVMAIVLPFGRDFVVAFLAALRLGLVPSFLPPLGPLYLKNRLAALKAAHIATDPLYLTLLTGQEKLVLSAGPAQARPYDRSFTYASKDPCALVFSPLRDPGDKPVAPPAPLSIDSAFLLGLRDALFTFSLGPGDVAAAPDAHPTQHQPALLVATLLAGGTFFHLTLADLTQDPRLLLELPLRSIGLTNRVRDLLRSKPIGAITTLSHFWKNPEEPFDAPVWGDFADGAGLAKVPSSNVLVDAAAGGATLFSVRRPRAQNLRVLPAAGGPQVMEPPVPPPWALYDMDGSGKLATGECGLYAPAPTKKPATLGHALVATSGGGEKLYAGTLAPRRSGRVYPTTEVLQVVSTLPFYQGGCVLSIPSGGSAPAALFVLLVFTGAEDPAKTASDGGARTSSIERAVEVQLGPGLAPDRIFYYPLYPRMKGPLVDVAWCEAQYHGGSLSRKSADPVFQKLTLVRGAFVKGAAG